MLSAKNVHFNNRLVITCMQVVCTQISLLHPLRAVWSMFSLFAVAVSKIKQQTTKLWMNVRVKISHKRKNGQTEFPYLHKEITYEHMLGYKSSKSRALDPKHFWFGILTFISMITTTSERLKARNFFICQYFSFYEQLKFRAQLSWAWKKFFNLGAWLLTKFLILIRTNLWNVNSWPEKF